MSEPKDPIKSGWLFKKVSYDASATIEGDPVQGNGGSVTFQIDADVYGGAYLQIQARTDPTLHWVAIPKEGETDFPADVITTFRFMKYVQFRAVIYDATGTTSNVSVKLTYNVI